MAPSPEIDNIPKAPDKSDKTNGEKEAIDNATGCTNSANDPKDTSVTNLDDGELKALLDEAINHYKSPKDRASNSELFNSLLKTAEDDLRTARATSASGPELARYFNSTATRKNRNNKRKPSSVSEHLTHGGSLNDLAKEELYESACQLQRPKKTVSARQREGGSLPCNVNAGAVHDTQFFLEAQAEAKCSKIREKKEYTAIDMMESESESLLDNDCLDQEFNADEPMEYEETPVSIGVDDSVEFNLGPSSNMTRSSSEQHAATNNAVDPASYKHVHSSGPSYGLLSMQSPLFSRTLTIEEKKVDENGNALDRQNNTNTKKRKNAHLKKIEKEMEGCVAAEKVKGHRADIIGDIDKLVEFISGTEEKSKAPVKKLHKHMTDEKGKHKQRTRSSKGSKCANMHGSLHKSNSMEEISTTKLEDLHFDAALVQVVSTKLALRSTKSNASERPRMEQRKYWNNSEFVTSNVATVEQSENADFTLITKKKKSKKRRNSLGNRRQMHSRDTHLSEFNRVSSPQLRRKSACSVPHSEKSNDSSDADSVHSLPNDSSDKSAMTLPVSYADMAKHTQMERPILNNVKNNERKKTPVHEKLSQKTESLIRNIIKNELELESNNKPAKNTEIIKKVKETKELIVNTSPPTQTQLTTPLINKSNNNKIEQVVINNNVKNNFTVQNWPEIRNNKANNYKNIESVVDWPSIQNNKAAGVGVDLKSASPLTPQPPPAMCGITNKSVVNIKNIKNNALMAPPPGLGVIYKEAVMVSEVPNHALVADNPHNCGVPVMLPGAAGVAVIGIICNTNVPPPPPNAILAIPPAVVVLNNTQRVIQTVSEQQQQKLIYPYQIPENIPDVQTIEKMHLKHLQTSPYTTPPPPLINGLAPPALTHAIEHTSPPPATMAMMHSSPPPPTNQTSDTTSEADKRPAVVILSGEDKHVYDIDITFGFDINEQLLSGDVCADFISRFFLHESSDVIAHLDKIVNYIGNEWEDVLQQTNSGKIKYYSEDL